MKFILHCAARGFAALAFLAVPLSVQAAPKVVVTSEQKAAAISQVEQALKTASAPNLKDATPKQISAAITSVMSKNRGNKTFLGALTEGLIQARPDMTLPIVKLLIAAVTPPGDCPPSGMVWEIVDAAVIANMPEAPAITATAIQQAPCRAAAITDAAVTANSKSANAIVVAAIAAAPATDKSDIVSAAVAAAPPAQGASIQQAAGSAPSGAFGSNGVTSTASNSFGLGTSAGSASTLNPANIGGAGGGPVRVPLNSSENINSN